LAKKIHTPIVWQLSVLQLDKKTLVSGVLLTRAPFAYDKRISNIRNFINVLKSYFIGVYAEKELFIVSKEHRISAKTNPYGGFSVVVDSLVDDIPEIILPGSTSPLRIIQNYPIIFPYSSHTIDVISDIDDTIIVSHSSNLFKRIKTLAFKAPHKRKSISSSSSLLNAFVKNGASVIYVSKSESNLFGLLAAYIDYNALPQGCLFLTSYLKIRQLFESKKGLDYKLDNIRFILENTYQKKYILIGDDSQKDIEVFLRVVEQFPERILKVYIRQTKNTLSQSQKQKWDQLSSLRVASLLYRNESENEVIKDVQQLLNTNL